MICQFVCEVIWQGSFEVCVRVCVCVSMCACVVPCECVCACLVPSKFNAGGDIVGWWLSACKAYYHIIILFIFRIS